jgi:hypothetical protein
VGAVLLLIIALYLDVSWRPSPRAYGLMGAATVFAAVGGVAPLRDYGRDLRSISDTVAPAVAAVQIVGNAIPSSVRPDLAKAPQIFAGPLRQAVAELGSPLPGGVKALLANPNAADAVDGTLVTSEGLALTAAPRGVRPTGTAPVVEHTVNGHATRRGGCVRFTPSQVPSELDVRMPPRTRFLLRDPGTQPVEVRLRRFGPDFPQNALGTLEPGQSQVLAAPRDTSPTPWVVRLSPATPVIACSA